MEYGADTLERKTTAHFPEASVEMAGPNSLKIRVESIRKEMLLDQGNDVQVDAGQGCISAPNGPRC